MVVWSVMVLRSVVAAGKRLYGRVRALQGCGGVSVREGGRNRMARPSGGVWLGCGDEAEVSGAFVFGLFAGVVPAVEGGG
ncbi:hypothetical protein GCM10010294_25280 [Streptomyces griseoloalbus]|nr:hypothetical protein GCM10010294_25280 [Streptomyces griseoloalbus]